MIRSIVIYNNSSCKKVSSYISAVLGPSNCCDLSGFKESYKKFELFIIVLSVEGSHVKRLLKFIEDNLSWLKSKKVILISEKGLEKDEAVKNLEKMLSRGIIDHKSIEKDSSTENIIKLTKEIKFARDRELKSMHKDKVLQAIEDFLIHHNTCTVATGYDSCVRATPIEYSYNRGKIYIITEGGEKMGNIYLNKMVSVAVYENYTTMQDLKGMQILGEAKVLKRNDDKYKKVLDMKKININSINSLPIIMNIIEISIKKVEFLYSEFAKEGFDAKQIYYFK